MAKKIDCEPLEQMCLYHEVMTGRKDWQTAWKLSSGRPLDTVVDMNSGYYKWRKSPRVERYIAFVENEKIRQEQLIRDSAKKEFESLIGGKMDDDVVKAAMADGGLATNFRDRDQFLAWLNTAANTVTDEKMRIDLLKMLADLNRFKENDNKDKVQDIQRFYTPLLCRDCELYLRQKEAMMRKEKER